MPIGRTAIMKGTTRRTVLASATAMLSAPFYLSSAKASASKKHVVLVHGAWHGAWAWQETIPLLTQREFNVSALDLSGMGTTAHLQSLDIGLHTHGQDILNHLFFFSETVTARKRARRKDR